MSTILGILRGAAAGVVATIPMSAVTVAAQALGALRRQPPQVITDAALDGAGVDPPALARKAAGVLAHLGFGATMGALFALLRRPRGRARGALEGAVWGTAVWTASYAGWIPALDIMPPPQHDHAGRPATMIPAHWVYGATLGALVARPR